MKNSLILFCTSFSIGRGTRAQNKRCCYASRFFTRRVLLKTEGWDVTYHLNIKVNPVDSTITGSNTIQYKEVAKANSMHK
jgi:hypothetical protein